MKLNKKTNKIILQKKDISLIIHKDGYICIDGYYIVKADLIELENELYADKVKKNEYFCYQNGHEANFEHLKTWENLLKADAGNPVKITNLFYETKRVKHRLIVNLKTNNAICINSDFIDIIESLNGEVTQLNDVMQKENETYNYSAIVVHKNGELIGMFMPVLNNNIQNELDNFKKAA